MPALLLAVLTAAPVAKTQIAVLELEAAGVPTELTETASLLVPTEVRKHAPGATVISGAEIRSMIGFEKQKALLGCADDSTSCMTELGGALGADELVTGKIGKLADSYVLELRRIDAKQARPIRSMTRILERDSDFIPAIKAGVAELYGVEPSAPARGGLRRYAWIPSAGAVVLGGVGAFALAQANSRHGELVGSTPSATPPERLRDEGRTYQAVGNVSLGVAVGSAAVALILYLASGSDHAPASTGAPPPTPAGVRW